MEVNMKYYSMVSIKYETRYKNVDYKKMLQLFIEISKFLEATNLDYLTVIDTYFDEKGYQKTRVCHEYKKNIESKIEKIEDKYNLYGIGFKTDKYNFMIDWNKNNDIFHISIDSNIFINEELINVIIQYIQDSLLVDCSFELDCLNKKYM